MDRSNGRRGFSLTEVLIASGIFSIVILAIAQFQRGARRMEERVEEVNGSLKSVMLASEFIRFDLGRALIHDAESEIKVKDGGGFDVTISDTPPDDMEQFAPVRISYELEAIPKKSEQDTQVYQLIRKSPTGSVYVKDCYLTEMTLLDIPIGQMSPHLAYAELTLVGTESPAAKERYISSQLIPIVVPQQPAPYAYIPANLEGP